MRILGSSFRKSATGYASPLPVRVRRRYSVEMKGLLLTACLSSDAPMIAAAVRREVFERALTAAASAKNPEPVMFSIAYQAAAAGLKSIAEKTWAPLAASGNQDASYNRQVISRYDVISRYIMTPARIMVQAPDKARAGTTITVFVVGRLLRNANVNAVRVHVTVS